ncbi:hypothetical protein [Clostridium tarantellae]|uniref:Nal1 N-terminal domain-containing protein n=1 Tax=Clostridium tarantellae TaxID=39493 RepID=A0A6I1MMA3_9CLOT|nr:hypothetical protein [Clostridium tarantellae]MPQ44110.1 hypothetical protein [Clostridium tarantellae]
MHSLLENSIIHIIDNYDTFFLSKKNVVGVALGNKFIKGIQTKEPVLHVFVKDKVPLNKLYKNEIIPKSFLGIKTDVIKSGLFKNINLKNMSSIKNPYDSNTDIHFLNSKVRPIQGGCSISPVGVDYSGTLGGIVFDNTNNTPYILSNQHCLSNFGKFSKGTKIVQPSNVQGKKLLNSNVIAKLFKSVKLIYEENKLNVVDASIAEINSNIKYDKYIYKIGPVTGTTEGEVAMEVKKTGITTGFTRESIISTNGSIVTEMLPGQDCNFVKQIITNKMSEPGDSGALVLNNFNKAVGILASATDHLSVLSPIDPILSVFNVHF